jgi:hypothetical protein
MLASVELKKRENRDDLDFLQMNGYIPCSIYTQALEFRTPLFPHLVPPAIMVWIFVWKYIFEPFIHILQHFVLQLSRSTNFLFLGPAAVLLIYT